MADQMYGAQQAGQNNLTGTTKRDTINGITVDLDRAIERMAKLCEGLRHIGDRLDGSRPEPVGTIGGPETPPGSMILDLRRKQTTLSNFLGKCEDEVQRLAQALGIG